MPLLRIDFRQGFELIGIEMPARLQRAGLELADGEMPLGRLAPAAGVAPESPSSAERPRPRPRLVSTLMRFPSAGHGRRSGSAGASAGWWRRSSSPASWI